MDYDVIIIGAGIAGLTSAIYTARAGKKTLVLEGKVYGGQIINTLSIENWPGDFKVSGVDLMNKVKNQATELGAEIELEEVEKVEKIEGGFRVVTEDGEYTAGAVIVAVGAEPRKLSEKQAADAGKRAISYCATCDGALYKGKPVVVVGSGNSAKYEIEYLEGIASKVYHIHHDDPIPEDAEAVFVAIGRVPSTGFLKGLVDMDEKGYIVAGEDLNTNTPGLFVAGDCRTKGVRQATTAVADGAIAALAAVKYLE